MTTGHLADLPIESYQERFHPGDHTLIDVREDWEWRMGHLPNALHIPMNTIPDQLATIPTDQPVVVVCGHGIRSQHVATFLHQQGYPEVYSLDEGTAGWSARGLPITHTE